MYESVGFIEDIILMSEEGMPLDNETLKEQLNQISQQVNRSNNIMSKLNWFAHSIDRNHDELDLGELIENLITLTNPLARIKNIQLQSDTVDCSVHLSSHSFHLINIIFTCLKNTISASKGDCTVTISGKKRDDKRTLIIITDKTSSSSDHMKTELPLLQNLMKELDGEFYIEDKSEAEGISLILSIPA